MLVRPVGASGHLPDTHYFITVARGRRCRTVTVRTLTARLGVALLALTGVWTLASSLYLGLRDDLVAAMMARETRAQYAYEDRIAALRSQLGSTESQRLLNQNAVETALRALTLRAATLESRATLVAQAVDRVGLGGPGRDALAPMPDGGGSSGEPARRSGDNKPHPDAESEANPAGPAAGARARLSTLTDSLDRIEAAQVRDLSEAGESARRTVAAFRAALAQAGLAADRFSAAPPLADAGGPFVPLNGEVTSSAFGLALASLRGDLTEAERLRAAMPRVPLGNPLVGAPEVTSPFGARLDPFLGRPALHTGVDLREASGTDVRATGSGRVVSAGPAGGYGTMVEVDHGSGLSTRYAHLSAVAVSPGERVAKGQVVGQVGATGRTTGPHLHYETRIDGEPVDPMRFLQAGQRLAAVGP